jgi:hypothetical protein
MAPEIAPPNPPPKLFAGTLMTEQPTPANTIDDLINHSFAETEKAEQDAQQIERRLRLSDLDHCQGFFATQRMQGEVRNPFGGRHKNLTAASQIQRKDPQLAAFLMKQVGVSAPAVDPDAAEREAAREAAAARMVAETERLRAQNDAVRARQAAERHANLPNRGGGAFFL